MKLSILTSALAAILTGTLSAQVENLWITEVVPSTGQIEVTNVSDDSITTTRSLPFCHRFNYATSVPSGTTFAPGQSRIYTVGFSQPGQSDLWIYSSGSFGSSDALLNGLKWGSASSIGRTGVAVGGNKWDSTSAFVPAPGPGEAILLTGTDPFSADHWTVGTPDLGNYAAPSAEVAPVTLESQQVGNNLLLFWGGGVPPYQLQTSTDLDRWVDVSSPTEMVDTILPISPDDTRRFYRVLSNASSTGSGS